MGETAGGCAVERQVTALNRLSKNYQQSQTVGSPVRNYEPAASGTTSANPEMLQLAGYKMDDALGHIASQNAPNICYVA